MKKSRVILLVALLVAVGVGFFFLPLRQWFTQLEGHVQSLGTLGPAVVVLAYVLCTVLLIPASIITLGAGTLFGLKTGFIVVVIGANLGALCSFLLARTFLREKVAHWAQANAKFRFLDEAIGRQGFKMVLLTRLSPIFPFILLNYFLGLTAVRTGAYVLANLFGMLPATFLFVYIGAAARDAIGGPTDTSADFYQQILKYVGLLATIGVVMLVTRMARRALREAEQSQEGSAVAGKPRFDPNYRPAALDEMTIAGDSYDQQLIDNCHPPGWVNPTACGKVQSGCHRRGNGRLSECGGRSEARRQGGVDRAQSYGRGLPERRLCAVESDHSGGASGSRLTKRCRVWLTLEFTARYKFRSCDGEDAAAAGRNQRARFRRPFPQTRCGRLHRQRAVYRTIDN